MEHIREGTNSMQKNGQPKVSKRVKTERALELRLAGASYRSISQALGCSCSHAFRLVDAALRESAEKCAEAAEKIRAIELARLDKIRVMLWPRRADPRVADTLIRLSERTARLAGLDKPVKIEASGLDGGPIEQSIAGPDLTELTDEELRQFSVISRKISGKG